MKTPSKTSTARRVDLAAQTKRVAENQENTVSHFTDEKEPADLHLYIRFTPPSEKDHDMFLKLHELYMEAEAWQRQQKWEALSTKITHKFPQKASQYSGTADLDDEHACLKAQIQLHDASSELITRMLNGDKFAAEALLVTAQLITSLLQPMYCTKPELFHAKTQFMRELPVLAGLKPGGWESRARKLLEVVRLGQTLAGSHLKPTAYKTERHVCRAWARRALEVLDHNRYGPEFWRVILPYLDAGRRPDLRLMVPPGWMKDVWQLPPLSKETVKQWGAVARELLREQVPDFHERAEFKHEMARIRMRYRHAADGGKRLTGTLQNALLDKIVNAMRSIVA